jgi:CheY-like chemotaxis protein
LFTGIVMPGGMNGYQLGETARQIRPEISVLFTTGYAHPMSSGSFDGPNPAVLRKPYHRRRHLAEAIHAALARPLLSGD